MNDARVHFTKLCHSVSKIEIHIHSNTRPHLLAYNKTFWWTWQHWLQCEPDLLDYTTFGKRGKPTYNAGTIQALYTHTYSTHNFWLSFSFWVKFSTTSYKLQVPQLRHGIVWACGEPTSSTQLSVNGSNRRRVWRSRSRSFLSQWTNFSSLTHSHTQFVLCVFAFLPHL